MNTTHNIIITGDITVDLLKMKPLLFKFLTKYQFKILYKTQTRITNTTATLIDVFVTKNVNIFNSTLCSNHCPILADICFKTSKSKPHKKESSILITQIGIILTSYLTLIGILFLITVIILMSYIILS